MGVVVGASTVVDVTLSLDTSQYASGDVLAATQEVKDVFRQIPNGKVILQSVVLIDEDDQAQALDLVFLNADGSLGAENAAVGPTDAVARTIVGIVEVAAADYVDLANSQVAFLNNIGTMMKAEGAESSIWIAAVSRGTGTYTAAGIKLKLGFLQD
jgi:preprotein translocase subunit Sec63